MTATLSLYKLDQELTDLLDLREQLLDESLPGDADLTGVDAAIQAYMEQLPRKVDGVAHVLRHFAEQVDFADREIKRLKARKAELEENAQRLKDYAVAVLEKQPAPAKGCRKLVGQHSTIMLKGNGGVQPLVIDGWDKDADRWISDPGLLPDELCIREGWIPPSVWCAITSQFPMLAQTFTRVPSNSLIREALIQPCAGCGGLGQTIMQALDTTRSGESCPDCSGTGKNAVPGAHLEPRGQHVEVK